MKDKELRKYLGVYETWGAAGKNEMRDCGGRINKLADELIGWLNKIDNSQEIVECKICKCLLRSCSAHAEESIEKYIRYFNGGYHEEIVEPDSRYGGLNKFYKANSRIKTTYYCHRCKPKRNETNKTTQEDSK